MILFLVVLSLLSLACLAPMLRDPYRQIPAPRPLFTEVPLVIHDWKGLV
jgi:hypothetical protein